MRKITVEYIDIASLYYSSYFNHGFDQLAKNVSDTNGHSVSLAVSLRTPHKIKPALADKSWQHLLFAMCLFRIQIGNDEFIICIDTHDASTLDIEHQTEGYHLPLLQSVDIYYKVNFSPEMIRQTPLLKSFVNKIKPISQFFPLRPNRWIPFLRRIMLPTTMYGVRPGLRHGKPYVGHLHHAMERLRHLKNFQTFQSVLSTRKLKKDIDVFFVTSFRQHPKHAKVMESRYRLMKELMEQHGLNVIAGFTSFSKLPARYRDAQTARLNQKEYLDKISRSRIVIYTQGIANCISSKFSLFIAYGCVAVGEPIINNPEMSDMFPHLKEQFFSKSPYEIRDRVIELTRNEETQKDLALLNIRLFHEYLSPEKTAQRILNDINELSLNL